MVTTDATRSLKWYGLLAANPQLASRRLHLGMACVAAADVLLLGGNAIIRMIAE